MINDLIELLCMSGDTCVGLNSSRYCSASWRRGPGYCAKNNRLIPDCFRCHSFTHLLMMMLVESGWPYDFPESRTSSTNFADVEAVRGIRFLYRVAARCWEEASAARASFCYALPSFSASAVLQCGRSCH
ncbi:unnamed protein product [Amoebophrya sp. A25]|nr:unnamed protein product [Amoebophrya sp. A25]|eukprot:GSA25T00005227001.1